MGGLVCSFQRPTSSVSSYAPCGKLATVVNHGRWFCRKHAPRRPAKTGAAPASGNLCAYCQCANPTQPASHRRGCPLGDDLRRQVEGARGEDFFDDEAHSQGGREDEACRSDIPDAEQARVNEAGQTETLRAEVIRLARACESFQRRCESLDILVDDLTGERDGLARDVVRMQREAMVMEGQLRERDHIIAAHAGAIHVPTPLHIGGVVTDAPSHVLGCRCVTCLEMEAVPGLRSEKEDELAAITRITTRSTP